jgi:hypothetical protein
VYDYLYNIRRQLGFPPAQGTQPARNAPPQQPAQAWQKAENPGKALEDADPAVYDGNDPQFLPNQPVNQQNDLIGQGRVHNAAPQQPAQPWQKAENPGKDLEDADREIYGGNDPSNLPNQPIPQRPDFLAQRRGDNLAPQGPQIPARPVPPPVPNRSTKPQLSQHESVTIKMTGRFLTESGDGLIFNRTDKDEHFKFTDAQAEQLRKSDAQLIEKSMTHGFQGDPVHVTFTRNANDVGTWRVSPMDQQQLEQHRQMGSRNPGR